ncbi:galactinol synthase 2-like [Phalaenopsis equestris]|uniref:galactinol synthase 2-like n=1 Tax=Phalaenopsis equestris TaxID=78828 RepID=UPI0009E60BF6|nr:galactinol synthase 2-like [Phalaenopsis equestris]
MAPEKTRRAVAAIAGFNKPNVVQRGAFVTFLAGDGDYVNGVVGLAKGLRKVRSAYPLIVAVLTDVPASHRRELELQGCIIREIDPVHPPPNQTRFAMAYYVINYSKLRIWDFVEYKKMVYLDADIQVFDNIDNLFELPDGYFYAVMDCFCEKTWSHSKQYEIGYCQQCPDRRPWPVAELGPPPSLYFNAGMFVFEPSVSTGKSLLSTLEITTPTLFAEQDFLNMYFRNIYKPIPLEYNLVMAMLWRHPEKVDLQKVKVVHYCAAGSKPWSFTGKEENMNREDIRMLVKRWWDIYNDKSLNLNPRKLQAGTREVGSPAASGGVKRPLMASLSKAGMGQFVRAPSGA